MLWMGLIQSIEGLDIKRTLKGHSLRKREFCLQIVFRFELQYQLFLPAHPKDFELASPHNHVAKSLK